MKYNYKIWLVSFALAGAMPLTAAYVSPGQAARTAMEMLPMLRSHHQLMMEKNYAPRYSSHAISKARSTAQGDPELVYIGDGSKNLSSFYVFNYPQQDGFVIISADDRLAPVLGYADSGEFDPENIPANMKVWLEGYSQEIASYLASDPAVSPGRAKTRTDFEEKEAVAPLITTKWNQDAPYNDQCPTINGVKAPTGCTATALAQIVNYHKWPQDYGNDSWSYERDGYSISFDFGSTKFDWDNMTDTYSKNSTAEEKEAVATLMRACGVVTDMFYDATESGAYISYIPDGLYHYLGYAAGARYVKRQHYSSNEWENLIYSELAAARPVQFEGYSSEGGHSFVVDGYLGNHFFHINWGWGGISDGYFLLSALNPEDQGIGSYEGGYNSYQAAVIGIRPDDGSAADVYVEVFTEGPLSLTAKSDLKLLNYAIHSSLFEHKVDFSLKLISTEGEEKEYLMPVAMSMDMDGFKRGMAEAWYGDTQTIKDAIITVDKDFLATIPAGSYKLYPMYKALNMDWTPIPIDEGANFLNVTIDGAGGMKAAGSAEENGIASAIALDRKQVYVWDDGTTGASFSYSLLNRTENDYFGNIKLAFVNEDGKTVVESESISISLPAKQTVTKVYSEKFPKDEGEYSVIFKKDDNTEIGDLPLVITPVERNDVMMYYAELPEHFYEKMDFRKQKLALWYYNYSSESQEVKPEICIVAGDDITKKLRTTSGTKRTMRSHEELRLEYGSWNLGKDDDYLPAGDYYMQVYNSLTDSPISLPIPIKIWKEADDREGLYVGLDGDKKAYVVAPSTSPSIAGRPKEASYEGILKIPVSVKINGEDYSVSSVAFDALTMANLDAVVLESADMDLGCLKTALSKAARNNSATYLQATDFMDLYLGLLNNGIESYALADYYRFAVTEGNLSEVSPENPVKGNMEAGFGTRFDFVSPIDLNVSVTTTSPNISLNYLDTDYQNNLVNYEVRVISSEDKGEITITPRQPYTEPIVLVVNGGKDSEGDDTGVDDVTEGRLQIAVIDGVVEVSGAEAGSNVVVLALDGCLIAKSLVSPDGTIRIPLHANGMYIVKIGKEVRKIML